MEHDQIPHQGNLDIPTAFVDYIVREIPAEVWARTIQENPILKAALLEGFSHRTHKPARLFRKPQFQAHMRRHLLSHDRAMEEALKVWGQENLFLVAFLEMLDRSFVLDNFDNLKNLLGPEPFFAALYLLGCLQEPPFRERIGEDYWMRRVNADCVEPLAPLLSLWLGFLRQFPQAQLWLESLLPPPSGEPSPSAPPEKSKDVEPSSREADRHRKLELKLERLHEEKLQLNDQVARLSRENQELRRKVEDWAASFDDRVEDALARERTERFRRYRSVDLDALQEAGNRLEELLTRADWALELQRQADERYGLASAVRRNLLRVELYLREIERIHADSLVVHSEVSRVKDSLLAERKRLLELPGIEKALREEPALVSSEDLRRKIRLLDAEPENLAPVSRMHDSLRRLASTGLIDDPQPLLDAIQQKKRQIMEVLYARFQPSRPKASGIESAASLEDLVESGHSSSYDLYVDGYNILLKAQGGDRNRAHGTALAALRDDFIQAVRRKAAVFRKVYLVFDGVQSHREVFGNVEIIYTDKARCETADSVIIQTLARRRDLRVLLVTADREIIEATEDHVFATVEPYHFYLFVIEADFPAPPTG